MYPHEFVGGAASRKILHYRLDGRYSSDVACQERLVDRVTSAVLMPEELVRKNMSMYGFPERIRNLNKHIGYYMIFCDMAAGMQVSRQALAIRLKTLGLLGEDHLKDPYEIMNVYVEENEIG